MKSKPCNCVHAQTIVVWTRGEKEPVRQARDTCAHPEGPHPMNEFCAWRTAKTQGAMA